MGNTKLTGCESISAVRNADRIWVSTPQNRTYRPENRINPVNLVLEEKTTRIVEVIVSSIKPHQLLPANSWVSALSLRELWQWSKY